MKDEPVSLVHSDLAPIALEDIPDFGHEEILEAEAQLAYLHREAMKAGAAAGGFTIIGIICILSMTNPMSAFGLCLMLAMFGGLSVGMGALSGGSFLVGLIRLAKQTQKVSPGDLALARLAAEVRKDAIEWNGARKALSEALVGFGKSARPEEMTQVLRTADGLADQRRQLTGLIDRLRNGKFP